MHVCPRGSLVLAGTMVSPDTALIDLSKCSGALLWPSPPHNTGVDELTLFCLVGKVLLVLPGVVFPCKVAKWVVFIFCVFLLVFSVVPRHGHVYLVRGVVPCTPVALFVFCPISGSLALCY